MERLDALRWPRVSDEAIHDIGELLRRGNTSFDEECTEAFEKELCCLFQVRHALLTCNGTSALFSCFEAAGLKAGDEIIAPPVTHWASVLPATRMGCRVAFADLEEDSLSVSVDSVKKEISPRTRAVVVCHMYGNPVDVVALRTLCDERGLVLIEDASHAPGATVSGQSIGSFGHLAAVSMQASKLISAGEGGVVLTNDDKYYRRAVELGHPKRSLRIGGQKQTIRVSQGFKFRISPLMVALARDSLRRLPEVLATRAETASILRESLRNSELFSFPEQVDGSRRVYWEYEMLLRSRNWRPTDAFKACRSAGLPAAVMKFEFVPDLLSSHQFVRGEWPNAKRNEQSVLVIPAFNEPDETLLDSYLSALLPSR